MTHYAPAAYSSHGSFFFSHAIFDTNHTIAFGANEIPEKVLKLFATYEYYAVGERYLSRKRFFFQNRCVY